MADVTEITKEITEKVIKEFTILDSELNLKCAAYHKAMFEFSASKEEFDRAITARFSPENEIKRRLSTDQSLKVELKFYGSGQTEVKWYKAESNKESLSMLFQSKENFLEVCEVFERAKRMFNVHPENKTK